MIVPGAAPAAAKAPAAAAADDDDDDDDDDDEDLDLFGELTPVRRQLLCPSPLPCTTSAP